MPGKYEYRRVVWRDYYSISSSNRQTTLYTSSVLLCIIIFSSPTIFAWTCLLSSPLYASTPMNVLATRLMNHAACNVESRPLTGWNSISIAQMVELTADLFALILRKTSTAERQPGHGSPEASSEPVGVGEQDEGVWGRGVILIASSHGKNSRIRLKKAEEPSPSRS